MNPGGAEVALPDGSTACECGLTHGVAIRAIVVSDDAVERLVDYLRARGRSRVLAVMDANTEAAFGHRVAHALEAAGIRVGSHLFPQRDGLLATPAAAASLAERLRTDGLPLAIGSGTITDIVRYAAHAAGRDFISLPTAASMDGYASSVAAMQLDGLKVTYPARAPEAIFADPAVAAAAPAELTRAGIGDLLAKATAGTDWLAAHLLYDEPYCAAVAARVGEPLAFAAANVDQLTGADRAAISGLLVGLLQSGVAMAMVGSSRPASGAEHHASHFWDLLAARGLRPHGAHGLQVGYATHFVMRLQAFAFAGGVAQPRTPSDHELLDAGARDWLGEPSPEIVAAVAEKRRLTARRPARWAESSADWERVRGLIAPSLAPFPAVARGLARAGIREQPGYLDIDAAMLRAALRYSNRLRARYTVVDFLEGQDALDVALDEVLAR